MKRLRLVICTLLLVIICAPLAAFASDISNARYFGVITISNNGTATTNVATVCDINTPALIDGNYLNSSANNSVVRTSGGADVPFMPGANATLPWCIWVPSIGANGIQSDVLYTANSTGGEMRYFPGVLGANITDDASMEPTANFTLEIVGWVDTDNGTDKNLIYKQDAFRTYISGAENITAEIAITTPVTLRPDGAGDETNLSSQPGPNNWADAGDNNDATYVFTNNVAYVRDFYTLADGSTGNSITSVTTYFRLQHSGGNTVTGKPSFKIGGNIYEGAEGTAGGGAVTRSQLFTTSPATGVAWTWAEINAMQIGISLKGPAPTNRALDIWIEVLPAVAAAATGVSSGEHTVTVQQGTGLDFSGAISRRVNCGDDISLDITTAITLEAWVRLDAVGQRQYVISRFDDVGNENYLMYVWDAANKPRMSVYIGGVKKECVANTAVVIDTWYHMVGTYDGANVQFYLDGVADGAAVPAVGAIDNDDVSFLIGGRTSGAGSDRTVWGIIDEVRIYSRAISPTEVAEHSEGHFNDETGLVSVWHFNEGVGATAYDSHGVNDGTLVGAIVWIRGLFEIWIDSILSGLAPPETVPGNANDWYIVENDSMPYMESYKHTVGGNLVSHIEWEYDDTTFTDLSGNSNDAYPSFRTASSDGDVSANMTSFLPIEEAKAPSYALGETVDFIDPNTTNVTGSWDVTPTTGGFPLAGVIAAVADATGTPPQLPLLIIACVVILGLSLSVSAMMRKHGSGTIFVKVLVVAAVMGVFTAMGNFGIEFWMILVFLTFGIAMAMSSKQVGWS